MLTALGFVYIVVYLGVSIVPMVSSLVIYCVWIVLFGIDLKHQILPDELLIVLFFLILLLGIPVAEAQRWIHVISGVFSGGFFLLIWLITKRRGLGFGDVKLAGILGLLLGHPDTIIALYIAFLTGAIVGVILMISHKAGMKTRIAFGPFLIVGAICASLWGERIWSMWNYLLL